MVTTTTATSEAGERAVMALITTTLRSKRCRKGDSRFGGFSEVNILYFGSLFDVKSQKRACVNYDEISRPVDSGLSHKKALERCVEHSKLWIANSDQMIAPNLTQGVVVHGQQDKQAYTQVDGGKSNRDYQQQYVPRGSLQNQRCHRGARRGYSNARGGRAGDGGYSNGRYESYDNSGRNGYQRSYYNSRGMGRSLKTGSKETI
ncbi:hypothetical protein F2Q69_00054380 [Brassica cretica]|uniref:Uncharacterized protein n=1 Tax=Brassica cretica TaxID=69181 RepID=A0A8S9MRJ8_BRACR|nr:hypothetical protein F2Q69_00054380 [Brassica cretica]